MITVQFRQGRGGGWRWFAYRDKIKPAQAMSPVMYGTKLAAAKAAELILGQPCTLGAVDSENFELYAGERDFKD